MENKTFKLFLAAWLSGFFAWGAIGHLTRLVWGTSLIVGCYEFTMPVSAILAVLLAAGSLVLGFKAAGASDPRNAAKTG